MKIKADFITNSSSTCFILISTGDDTKEAFLSAAGLENDSPFAIHLNELYDLLQYKKEPIKEYLNARPEKQEGMSADLLRRIESAERAGHTVFMGDFHSEDGVGPELFFCMDSFVIDGDTMYLDAVECYW